MSRRARYVGSISTATAVGKAPSIVKNSFLALLVLMKPPRNQQGFTAGGNNGPMQRGLHPSTRAGRGCATIRPLALIATPTDPRLTLYRGVRDPELLRAHDVASQATYDVKETRLDVARAVVDRGRHGARRVEGGGGGNHRRGARSSRTRRPAVS